MWRIILRFLNSCDINILQQQKINFSKQSFFNKIFLSLFYKHFNNQIIWYRRTNLPYINYFFFSSSKFTYKSFSLYVMRRFVNSFPNKISFSNFYLMYYIFKKHFAQFFSNLFFYKIHSSNLIKVFSFFVIRYGSLPKQNVHFFNLNKYEDWYKYASNNSHFFLKKPSRERFFKSINNIFNWNVLNNYYKRYNVFFTKLHFNYLNTTSLLNFSFNKNNLTKINLDYSLKDLASRYFPVRFNESSSNKFIELHNLSNYVFFYLRKNKIFNKGRYSRNRQTYRTGVYWCLWFNILSIYGLYFIFYRFTFNFGYLWLPLIIFFGSFIFSRALKYNFISYKSIFNEVDKFLKWCSLIYFDFSIFLKRWFQHFFSKNVLAENINMLFKVNKLSFFFNKISYFFYQKYFSQPDFIHEWGYVNSSNFLKNN